MNQEFHLVQRETTVKGDPFFYYAPAGDETVCGTYAAIKEDDFKLENINIEDGDVILDLGSNVGFSCLFAKIYPCTKILAFDANPLACLCAKMNRCRNSITNLEIFNKAIGSENKKDVEFYSNAINISASVEKKYADAQDTKYKCDSITISDIFDSPILGVEKVKYLKIDIEGGEWDIMNYICDKRRDLIERIENLHLEIHAYPWAAELKEKVRDYFGDKYLNY